MQDWSCATLRGLCAPEARGSPALAEGGAGAPRHRAGTAGSVRGCGDSPAPPGAAGPRGGEPRVGHGTFLLWMGGEQRGAQRGRVGWTGHVGESDGAEQGGHSCPVIPRWHCWDGTFTGTWHRCPFSAQGCAKGVPSPLAVSPVAPRTVPLLAATGEGKLGPGATGDTAPGSFPA